MSAPTLRQLASRQARKLETFNEKILAMSAEWEDVDQYNMNILADAHAAIADVVRQLRLQLQETAGSANEG